MKTRYFVRYYDGIPCYYLVTGGDKFLEAVSCADRKWRWDSAVTLTEAKEADYLTEVTEEELALIL